MGIPISYIGYTSAQTHYAKLKERFFQQLELTTQQQNVQNKNLLKNEIENSLYNAHLKDDLGNSAGKIINQIFNDLVGEFNKSSNIQSWKERAVKILQDAEYNKKKLSQEEAAKLNKALRQSTLEIQNELQYQLLRYLRKNTIGSSANAKERFSMVLANASTFLITYLKAQYSGKTGRFKLYGWPMKTLAGFINEDLAYRGLKQIFNSTNMTITPGGTKTFGGKMIEMDNIISAVSSTLGLNKQLSVTTNTEEFLKDYNTNLERIQYFGEQVKSFELGDIKREQRISNRSGLRDEFLNKYKNRAYILEFNRQFMSMYKNILTVFRPDTLFFTGKDQKMFMSDFISSFRKQGFLLQLEMFKDASDKLTITDTVVLAYDE